MLSALERRPVRGAQVLAQPSADTLILLNPEDGQYFTLDEVGARVWHLCDGSRSVRDVIATLHGEFDAPLDMIQTDVLELVDDLVREKLVAAA